MKNPAPFVLVATLGLSGPAGAHQVWFRGGWTDHRTALSKITPGEELVFAPGELRETIDLTQTPLAKYRGPLKTRIFGAQHLWPGGAPTVIKGSDVFAGFQPAPAVGEAVFYKTGIVMNEANNLFGRTLSPSQVFHNGRRMVQYGGEIFGGYPTYKKDVDGDTSLDFWPDRLPGDKYSLRSCDVTYRGCYFYEAATQTLYIKVPGGTLAGVTIEIGKRRYTLNADNIQGVEIGNFVFAHSSGSLFSRDGMVRAYGNDLDIHDNVFQESDGQGLHVWGEHIVLRNNKFLNNGQLGLSAVGNYFSVDGNTFSGNNTRGFNAFWEAGGAKFIGDFTNYAGQKSNGLSRSEIMNNTFSYTNGSGLWFDTLSKLNRIHHNTFAYNELYGLHYEVCTDATVYSNVSYGNGAGGFYFVSGARNVALLNVSIGDQHGIAMIRDSRTTTYGWDNHILGNVVLWTGPNGSVVCLPDFDKSLTEYNESDYNLFGDDLSSVQRLRFYPRTDVWKYLTEWRAKAKDRYSYVQVLSRTNHPLYTQFLSQRKMISEDALKSFITSYAGGYDVYGAAVSRWTAEVLPHLKDNTTPLHPGQR